MKKENNKINRIKCNLKVKETQKSKAKIDEDLQTPDPSPEDVERILWGEYGSIDSKSRADNKKDSRIKKS